MSVGQLLSAFLLSLNLSPDLALFVRVFLPASLSRSPSASISTGACCGLCLSLVCTRGRSSCRVLRSRRGKKQDITRKTKWHDTKRRSRFLQTRMAFGFRNLEGVRLGLMYPTGSFAYFSLCCICQNPRNPKTIFFIFTPTTRRHSVLNPLLHKIISCRSALSVLNRPQAVLVIRFPNAQLQPPFTTPQLLVPETLRQRRKRCGRR